MFPFSRFTRYFLEVAAQGSLRKAAEVLHVSASAIDRQILQAEQEFQLMLFERLPSGLKLTAGGELLLHDLRRWRKEYGRTLEQMDDLKGLRRGHVSIAMIDALSEGIVTQAIAKVSLEYPDLKFDLRVVGNREVAALISSSEVDFGLLLNPQDNVLLEVRSAVDIPMGLVMPLDHPLAGEASLPISRILEYRQLVPGPSLRVHEQARAIYGAHWAEGSHAIVCDDVRMMRTLIRGGAGVGLLSLLDVVADVQDRRLAFVPLRGRAIKPLALTLCVAPRRQLSRAAQTVIERVIAEMATLKAVLPTP